MNNDYNSASPFEDPIDKPELPVYEIRVKGCMDEIFWSDWFGEMQIGVDPMQGETTLTGTLADQAELYGMLSRLRNKGLLLVSVQQIT